MALKRGIVKLVEFDPNWKDEYYKEEKLLKNTLKDNIIEIHHVGSTSIQGLMAKPVIDILVIINSLDEIPAIEKLLKPYDYENMGQHDISGRYFFAKGPNDARTYYIHFAEPNSDTYYNQIYFKKYLIEHPKYKKEYCNLKKDLAKKFADDRPKYTQGKNEFISKVIKLAKGEYNK